MCMITHFVRKFCVNVDLISHMEIIIENTGFDYKHIHKDTCISIGNTNKTNKGL